MSGVGWLRKTAEKKTSVQSLLNEIPARQDSGNELVPRSIFQVIRDDGALGLAAIESCQRYLARSKPAQDVFG
jgi:hypothetical protein